MGIGIVALLVAAGLYRILDIELRILFAFARKPCSLSKRSADLSALAGFIRRNYGGLVRLNHGGGPALQGCGNFIGRGTSIQEI